METETEQQARIPEARRAALLDAAAEVFFRIGFAKARIDDVIAIAGGSKRNIYDGFGGKEGLFEALLDRHIKTIVATIEASTGEGTRIEDRLTSFGERIAEVLFSPAMLGVSRAMIADGAQVQSSAARFFDEAPRRAVQRLAGILTVARNNGELDMADAAAAADQFLSLLRGSIHMELLYGLREPLSTQERSAHVRASVAVFLDGYRPRR